MLNHFAVTIKSDRSIPAAFEGGSVEVVSWLKNQLDVSLFEVFDTQGQCYLSVRNFLTVHSIQFVPKFYHMDVETEDIILSGRKLKRGMRVLIESSDKRIDVDTELKEWEYEKALENNRWCAVGDIEIDSTVVYFVGIYDDGSKRVRSVDLCRSWIVKIDSVKKVDDRQAKLEQIMIKALSDAINIQSFTNSSKDKEVALGTVVRDSIKKIQGLQ